MYAAKRLTNNSLIIFSKRSFCLRLFSWNQIMFWINKQNIYFYTVLIKLNYHLKQILIKTFASNFFGNISFHLQHMRLIITLDLTLIRTLYVILLLSALSSRCSAIISICMVWLFREPLCHITLRWLSHAIKMYFISHTPCHTHWEHECLYVYHI